tara:strand:- start:8426 stop:9502 length:1077 start_codon:yes stop_codon:yes gene_type:complete
MIQNYKRYIFKKFLLNLAKVTLVFCSVILIMNLFEEISFFKDNEEFILLPIYLTLLNIPSVLFEIFPFIFLITTLFFFIEVIDKEEINILKLNGVTNLKIIQILSILTFFIGILILIFFYNISSNLKFFYFDLKNQFTKDDKYLAVVTGNGLWIRDEVGEFINYINADKLENDNLYGVTISQFNKNFEIENVIISEKVNIKNKNWVLDKPIVNSQNNSSSFDKLEFYSNFDEKRMLSIFDNLSSLDFFKLEALKKDYEMLGYNTEMINGYKHRLYSYPLYLAIMVCIGSILMLNIKHNKSKVASITLGIIISVLIYYVNYFFNVVIETRDVPYLTSIWGPQIILSLVIITNLIKINEK